MTYRAHTIEPNPALYYLRWDLTPALQIIDETDCDALTLYAETIEEAKEVIDEKLAG